MITAKYVHTNLIAEDWHSLVDFYQRVFGCIPVPPERDLQGEKLVSGTGVSGAHLRGMHLKLPGYPENGPTLEIFTYTHLLGREVTGLNHPGFGHIAFRVSDVQQAQDIVIANGGHVVGEIVTLSITAQEQVTWCYMTDPEGNMIELQSWSGQKTP